MLTPKLFITLPEDDDEGGKGEGRHFAPIVLALEAMVSVNLWHIRRSLKKAQRGIGNPISPLYMTGVRYKEDPAGEENWRDCYSVLARGFGDCLPLDTLIMREDRATVRIVDLKRGDRIYDGDAWTEVQEIVSTGDKPILAFQLDNVRELRCSPEHKLFLKDGTEIAAKDVRKGMDLLTPRIVPTSPSALLPPFYWVPIGPKKHELTDFARAYAERQREAAVQVIDVTQRPPERCGDIKTEAGRYWLPESDVIVHNCDNLVSWRTAELRAAGIQAEPVIKWQHIPKQMALQLGYPSRIVPDGGLWMVHCLVRWPSGDIEDPSKILGMGGSYTNRM